MWTHMHTNACTCIYMRMQMYRVGTCLACRARRASGSWLPAKNETARAGSRATPEASAIISMRTTSRHGIRPMRQPTARHTTALTHRAQQRQAPRRRLGHKRRTARSFYACTHIHMYAYVYTCAWSTQTQSKKNSVPLPHGACCVHIPLPLAMFITVLVHACMQ